MDNCIQNWPQNYNNNSKTMRMTASILLTQFSHQPNWTKSNNRQKKTLLYDKWQQQKFKDRSKFVACICARRKHVQLSNRHSKFGQATQLFLFCCWLSHCCSSRAVSAASIFHQTKQGYLIYVFSEHILSIDHNDNATYRLFGYDLNQQKRRQWNKCSEETVNFDISEFRRSSFAATTGVKKK